MQKTSVFLAALMAQLDRCCLSRLFSPVVLFILIVNLLGAVHAGPFMKVGDERLRHHIQLLADKKIITVPITTWPLMWSGVIDDVMSVDYAQLNEQTLWSVQYVKHAFAQQTGGAFRFNSRIAAASEVNVLKHFSSEQFEQTELKTSVDWMGNRLAVHLEGAYVEDPLDGKTWRADGSYISYSLGNWAVNIGAIHRWWGPGWHSSLTLSNNARPMPGLSLQRNQSDAFHFKTPLLSWLSWLGPWQFTSMANRLESSRHVPNAYFLGARFSFKPLNNLEVALSRTAQWGGEGRPQSLSSLKDLILGDDNRGSGDIAIDGSNEPGNQQASLDMRYHFALAKLNNALYFQFTGEDEAGGLPSRGIVQLGLESSFMYRDMQHRLILEAIDTASESYSEKRFNYAYEHGIYKSGYRYRQRPIGASVDNDSRYITLAMDHYLVNG
ncbi:MAG: capsule assembly Wzi family protein, partial [Pseudomonadales bacterium]